MQTHRRNSQVPATSHSEREIKPPKTGSDYVSAHQQCWRMISIRDGKHCGHPAALMSHTGSIDLWWCGLSKSCEPAGSSPRSIPRQTARRECSGSPGRQVLGKSPAVIFAGPSWDCVCAGASPWRPAPGPARRPTAALALAVPSPFAIAGGLQLRNQARLFKLGDGPEHLPHQNSSRRVLSERSSGAEAGMKSIPSDLNM
jgi:hypothetical protein